jgi:hypothetical protein
MILNADGRLVRFDAAANSPGDRTHAGVGPRRAVKPSRRRGLLVNDDPPLVHMGKPRPLFEVRAFRPPSIRVGGRHVRATRPLITIAVRIEGSDNAR